MSSTIYLCKKFYIIKSGQEFKHPWKSSINGSTNKVVINENSNFWDDSFPDGYEVVDSLGNKLEPTNKSNY